MMSGEAIRAQMAICVRSSSFVTQSAPVCHNHSPTTAGGENQVVAHRHSIPHRSGACPCRASGRGRHTVREQSPSRLHSRDEDKRREIGATVHGV